MKTKRTSFAAMALVGWAAAVAGLAGEADSRAGSCKYGTNCPVSNQDAEGCCKAPVKVDGDNDGLYDYQDKCPTQAEDKDGFEDTDGCPDPDNDGDGMVDGSDTCPLEKEDVNGFEDADGCPDEAKKSADDDGDGVGNSADVCRTTAEDKDGFQDADGCPDPDNDNDGLLDTADPCRDEPEDKNGFEDDDGCPDAAKKAKLEGAEEARARAQREYEAAMRSAATRRTAGVALLVTGGAALAAMGGMIGWRQAQFDTARSGLDTKAAVLAAIDGVNLATGLAVGTGVLGGVLTLVGAPLYGVSRDPAKPAEVKVSVGLGGVVVGGRW
jgi:hypothetical protein